MWWVPVDETEELGSRWKKIKNKNYSSRRWHNWYFNETSVSKDMEYDWAQSAEWRYPKGIVLSPNSRVTGQAQIITVKGVLLLTPKSVNKMMNTKVQHYWETPSQPCGRWRWKSNAEDEKAMLKVGNKNEAVGIFIWQINTAGNLWKFLFDGIDCFLPSTTSCLPPLLAPILIVFTSFLTFIETANWVDLVSPTALNFGVQCIIYWLWHQ